MAHLGKRPKLNSFPTSQKIAIKIIEPQFPESEIWKSGKTIKAVMSYECMKCPPVRYLKALWPAGRCLMLKVCLQQSGNVT